MVGYIAYMKEKRNLNKILVVSPGGEKSAREIET